MLKNLKTFKYRAALSVFIFAALLSGSRNTFSYVMPSEQLLGFMIKNFSGYRSVVLMQSTVQTSPDNQKEFSEHISLESPDKYSIRLSDPLEDRGVYPDLTFRQFLIANSRARLEHILLATGIDITRVSYTRIDGKIAYCIGSALPGDPKLLIEKERFIPLLLIYNAPDDSEGMIITVRFKDYRKEKVGWYPFEIEYNAGEDLAEKYTIRAFQFNVPVDSTLLRQFPELEIPEAPVEYIEPETGEETIFSEGLLTPEYPGIEEEPEDEESPLSEENPVDEDNPETEDERLRKVIEAFEEQYE